MAVINLPCVRCGQTAAVVAAQEIPEPWSSLISSGLSSARLFMPAAARAQLPRVPDGENPLLHLKPEWISTVLGLMHPSCAAQLLDDREISAAAGAIGG